MGTVAVGIAPVGLGVGMGVFVAKRGKQDVPHRPVERMESPTLAIMARFLNWRRVWWLPIFGRTTRILSCELKWVRDAC